MVDLGYKSVEIKVAKEHDIYINRNDYDTNFVNFKKIAK